MAATPVKGQQQQQAELLFITPCKSLLKSAGPARRIEQQSALNTGGQPAFKFLLDHHSLFDKVSTLESEKCALQQTIEELRRALAEQHERATAATASLVAAATLAAASQPEAVQRPEDVDVEARIGILQKELAREQAERRKLHDELVDLRGNVSYSQRRSLPNLTL